VVKPTGGSSRNVAAHDLPVDHSRDVFSVPNVLTVLRFVLIPFFFWFLVEAPQSGRNDAAFLLFAVCAGTDWVDGVIARATGHVTAIGKIIDPLVDRLLIASALLGLVVVNRVSLLLLLVLVGRDVYLLYGAWVLERHSRRVAVTFLGKTTTFVLLTGFASLIWDFPLVRIPALGTIDFGITRLVLGGVRPLGSYIVYLGVVMSLTAAAQYTVIARRAYREALAEQAAPPTS
jgi:cardiolipin synthase (CMP-forming)